jgi:hypothetical protein
MRIPEKKSFRRKKLALRQFNPFLKMRIPEVKFFRRKKLALRERNPFLKLDIPGKNSLRIINPFLKTRIPERKFSPEILPVPYNANPGEKSSPDN